MNTISNYVLLPLAFAAVALGCGRNPQTRELSRLVILNRGPAEEPRVTVTKAGITEVIYPVSVVDAIGEIKWRRGASYPHYVAAGGSGSPFRGEARDFNGDGIFDSIKKQDVRDSYSLGDLERFLYRVRDEMKAHPYQDHLGLVE